jgi:signal transduction histidine kinase
MLLDEKKIKQVLMNLIMNAKHAIGQKGTLHITTRLNPSDGRVAVKIADTGHGIEKKNLARIFDPFFTTKPTGEGTGLGLSVSYGIIKNHGGDILVESDVGKGSTFTILLPVVSPNSRIKDAKISPYRR